MADIDNLNFKVLLNDDEFNKKVEKDIQLAEKLNTTLSNVMNMKLDVGNVQKHTTAIRETNTALSGTESLMRTISQLTGIAFGVAGIRRFTSELIKTTGAFEVQKMALTSMLQDAEKADEIFSTLRKNALESPYTFQDLTKFAKQLTAFNIPTDQLVETEKRLADVAAGLGVDMGRIILAYGQVKAAGVLKGTELRQFTEAGVPLLEQLAKQIEEVEGKTVSLSEVFSRITKKQIPFEMVEEAFRRMTSEGGKFFNMQSVLVETLQGKIGKLRDVWQQALYDLGTANSGLLKGGVDAITAIVANLDEIGKRLPELITAWGAYATVQAVVEAGSIRLAVANSKVITALKSVFSWVSKNPYAILAAGLVIVTTEAIRFGKEIYDSTHKAQLAQKEFNNALKETSGAISAEREELRRLAMIAGNELNTMKQRTDAIDVINAKYGEYLNNLGIEKVSVDNLGTAYDKLTEAIANKYLAQLREQTVAGSEERLADARTALIAFNADFIKKTPITRGANVGKTYGAGGLGKIQGEIERFISEHPNYDMEALTNAIANIYYKYGLEIKAGSAQAGQLYKVASDYVEASQLLKTAENNFNSFAKGYGTSLGLFGGGAIVNNPNATPNGNEWGNDWNPLGGNKNPVVDTDKAIAEADKELAAILKETTKELDDRIKAMDEFEGFISDWERSSGVKFGSGVKFKLSSLIADKGQDDLNVLHEYEKQTQNITTAFQKGTPAYEKAKKKLDEWKASMDSSNMATFQEKVRGLADDIFKEGMEGFDLTNWNEKTLSQILKIKEAVAGLEIPDDIKGMLDKDSLDILQQSLKKLLDSFTDKTITPETMKKVASTTKYAAREVLQLASAFSELGEATGDARLQEAGDSIQRIGDFASSVSQGWQQGGVAGAAIGAVVSMATMIMSDLAKDEREVAEQTERAKQAAISYAKAMKEAAIAANDTIFGTNDLGKFREYISLYEKQKKIIQDLRKALDEKFPGLSEALGYGDDDESFIAKLKSDLEAGNLQSPNLLSFLQDYEEAAKAIDDTMESIFGNIVSDAADKIVDTWWEAGNAALDYADILGDVAKAYAKMMVQQLLFDEVFDDSTQTALKEAFRAGDASTAMRIVAEAMERAEQMLPVAEKTLEAFEPYRNLGSGVESNSLGSGIKSITEDTASLLASYINAIRADVSAMRLLQEKGFASIELLGTSVPTLNEYLAQIAASNFDIAQSNQSILNELRSVIGSPGTSGMVVRVETA